VAKVKPDGSALDYSTYLGGSGSDGGEGVAVDGRGRAHVTGATASANFPTVKAFQAAKGGGFVDAFVAQVNESGGSLVSSSYLGGRDDDQAAGIAVDNDSNVVVAGYTNSADFPIAKPFQPGKGGGVGDAFVTKVRDETAAESTRSAPASARREQRVRLLVTITGGLFIAAVLQTVWLRRRPEPPRPEGRPQPAGAGLGPEGPALPGLSYTPRREPVGAGRSRGDGRALRAGDGAEDRARDRSADRSGVKVLDDRSLEDLLRAAGGEDRRDPWRPEELAPDPSETPPWEETAPRRLRRVKPPAAPTPAPPVKPTPPSAAGAGAPRMVAPDLWASDEALADTSAAIGGRASGSGGWERPEDLLAVGEGEQEQEWPAPPAQAPAANAADELEGPDHWPTDPSAVPDGEELDPADVWGPLAEPADPDAWAHEVLGPAEIAPPPAAEVAAQEVAFAEPTWAAEPEVERRPAVDAELAAEVPPEAPPPPVPEPETGPPGAAAESEPLPGSEPEPTGAEMSAAFAEVVGSALGLREPDQEDALPSVEDFAPVTTESPPAAAESEWAPAEPVPDPYVEAMSEPTPPIIPPAAPPPIPHELPISQLLDEDLPIPEPEPGVVEEPEADRLWIEGILEEDFVPAPEPGLAEPPPDSGLAEPPPADGSSGETDEEPLPDDLLPPPPPRLLENLFEPDPDDPLVRATRHGKRGS
jgi:hypothetical protein